MKSSIFLLGHPAPQTLPQTGTMTANATNKTIPLNIFLDMIFSSSLLLFWRDPAEAILRMSPRSGPVHTDEKLRARADRPKRIKPCVPEFKPP
jgi:hypothetical protein